MSNIESNELIARFMGLETQLNTGPGYKFPLPITKGDYDTLFQIDCGYGDEMLYDSSWDWLMPVCKKICKTTPYNSYLAIETITVFADIEEVYKAVIEFIEWHNKPNKMEADE